METDECGSTFLRCDVATVDIHRSSKAHLLQKNQEGYVGGQRGGQRALTGDQVETSGSLDGALLPTGRVLGNHSGCAVIRHHLPVTEGGRAQHRQQACTQKNTQNTPGIT